jgi:inorganic pyrophosphatase
MKRSFAESVYLNDAKGTNMLFTPKPAGTFAGSLSPQGEPGTADYRVYFQDPFGKTISPWHNIRMQTAEYGLLNTIIEIPKMTTSRMIVATDEENNPIAPEVQNGVVQTTHEPILWNKGVLPETWAHPDTTHPTVGKPGTNAPLDVVEIGSQALEAGSVVPVKPLGIMALIHDGKLEWKIIAVWMEDPLAKELHDLVNLEEKYPEVISGIREWFRSYKNPEGKPLNSYGYDEQAQPRAVANEVIASCFDGWRNLRAGTVEGDAGRWTQHVKAWADGVA